MCSWMRHLCLSLLLLMALLFAVNCDDENNQAISELPTINDGIGEQGADGDDSVANVNKINTLCSYETEVSPCRKGCVLRDSAQFAVFLENTRYKEARYGGREMTHEPDFDKWVYLAFSGNDWPRIMGDIVEGEDTVTVGYTIYQYLSCEEQAELFPNHGCILYTPIPSHVYIYYMPFTEKAIAFSETMEIDPIYGK